MANKEPKVKVQNLTKRFGDLLVLDNLNFEVEEGEFLCIVGPTGCGKTTFLNSLTRLYEPTAGDILVNGIPVDPKKQKYILYFSGVFLLPVADCGAEYPLRSGNQENAQGGGGCQCRGNAGYCRFDQISQLLSQSAFHQYAAARCYRACICNQTGAAFDG